MRIGLCGSHGAGKSTLARQISSEFGLPFVASSAGGIVKAHGFDMARDNRLNTGLLMQGEIFVSLVHSIKNTGGSFVSDRTPIDVAAYMLADATACAGDDNARAGAIQLVQKALIETEALFDIVILVPPGIPYDDNGLRPNENEAYAEHHHMLCRGILFDEDLDLYWDEIRRTTFSIEERMNFIRGTIAEWHGEPVAEAA